MLIEATLVGLGILVWKKLGQGHEWTPEHEEMYQNALEHLKGEAGVKRLHEIADVCEKNGHHVKAFALRERAKLRSTSPKVKAQRKAVYDKAMRSENVEGILKVAQAFESISATGAAANLRARAEHLQGLADGTIAPASEPKTEVATRVAPQAEPEPVATPAPGAEASTPEVAVAEAEVVIETPKPRRRNVERARPTADLQEVRVATRTTPAPPPPVAAEAASEELNGAGHLTPEEPTDKEASVSSS